MTFKAILWDNDGILVDTEQLYYQATRETLATVGVELTEQLYLQLFLVEGRGAWHLAQGLSADKLAELKARRDARHHELLSLENPLLAGVTEVLHALRPHYRMAVVTSAQPEHFRAMHRATGLLPFFEFVLTSEDYQHSKPEPEPYLRAVDRMGLPKEQCLVIEDSERGLRAAKAAGLTCWVIPRGLSRHGCFDRADRSFSQISEIVPELVPQRIEG